MYFYRDNTQKEVDLIEEQTFDRLRIYEIKSAKRYNLQFAAGLDYFKKLYGEKVTDATVLYDGDESATFNGVICWNWRHY